MTGVELIAQERIEQIEKHNRTIEQDVNYNSKYQLTDAASILIRNTPEHNDRIWEDFFPALTPKYWNTTILKKMFSKSYKERLIIAGALIAAEIDRIQHTENNK